MMINHILTGFWWNSIWWQRWCLLSQIGLPQGVEVKVGRKSIFEITRLLHFRVITPPDNTWFFRAKIAAKPPTVYHLAILTLPKPQTFRYSKKHIGPQLKVCCQQKVIKYWPQPQTLVVGKNPSKILVDLLQVWSSPKCINTVISWIPAS